MNRSKNWYVEKINRLMLREKDLEKIQETFTELLACVLAGRITNHKSFVNEGCALKFVNASLEIAKTEAMAIYHLHVKQIQEAGK